MQVALVCNSAFGTDGISMFVLNNHRFFKREGTRYHLVYSSIHSPEGIVKGYVDDFKKNGDEAIYIPKGQGLLGYAIKLRQYFKKEKIDVLHVHGSSSAILIEMIVAKMAGVKKIVAHSHNTRGNHNIIHKILRPIVNRFADEKLACGELAGKWMYGQHGKFTIIPNCIDTEKYRYDEKIRKEVREEFGIDETAFVIGHVGMFTEIKNQNFLLHLIDYLRGKGKYDCKLLLVGHGPLMEEVQKESARLGLTKSVIFLGNRNDVYRIMMAMDVFCLPSLYEGFPIVSVEAQASGLPSLLSKNISPEVCITDLVKLLPIEGGIEPWCDAIMDIDKNKKERSQYVQRIKDAGYDINHSSSMLEELYRIQII